MIYYENHRDISLNYKIRKLYSWIYDISFLKNSINGMWVNLRNIADESNYDKKYILKI